MIRIPYVFYYCIYKWNFHNMNSLHAAKKKNQFKQKKNERQDSMNDPNI